VEQGFGQSCARGSSQNSKVAGMDGDTPLVRGHLVKCSRGWFLALHSVRLVSLEGKRKKQKKKEENNNNNNNPQENSS